MPHDRRGVQVLELGFKQGQRLWVTNFGQCLQGQDTLILTA